MDPILGIKTNYMHVSSAYITDYVTEINLLYKVIIGSEGVWKNKIKH